MPPTSPPMLSAGQQLGGYGIVELVGRGGMGEVYRARQLSMEREVALKVLAPRLVRQDPAFAEKFVAEARAAGRLNHPNIVAVHDVATAPAPEGCHGMTAGETVNFFSMEFITGETVRDVIERQGAVDLDLVARVMAGMAEALVFAEANRIVHRDIKPDNIMLPTLGGVKLADLGLALQIGEEDAVAGKDEQGRSKVMGTPLYIAPEQAQAKTVDHRSDQYALGATLFHMLTGRPPYSGDNSRAIMRAHCFDPVPDPVLVNPQVPPPWRDLCMRLMAKDIAGRFPTSSELRVAVKAAVRWRPGPAPRTRLQRRQNSWIGLAVIVVVAIVVLWLTFGLTQRRPPPVLPEPPVRAPVKPVAPVDPTAAARERAAVQLAHLPSDPAAALVAVEALIANPSLVPARAELIQRRDELQARIREQRRQAHAAKLASLELALAAGHLAEVRDGLAAVPETPGLRERRDALAARLLAAERAAEGRLAAAIAAAADSAGCDRISPEVENAGLSEPARNDLRRRLSERRAAIIAAASRPAQEAGPLWRRLGDKIDPLRGSWPYAAFGEACHEAARSFPDPDREVVRTLAEISDLGQKAESALRVYIAQASPKAECRFANRIGTFLLTRLEKDLIFFKFADGPAESRIDRAAAELPWRQLLRAALEGGKGEPRCEAAFLWYWRSPESGAAIEQISQDPLGKALATFKRRAALLDVAGSIARRDDQVAVTYDFAGKRDPGLLADWAGDGMTLSERGLRWQTEKTVSGVVEADLPSVRWKASLKPPLSLDVVCQLDSRVADSMIGLAVGPRMIRIALSSKRRKAFIVATTADGNDKYEVLGLPGLDVVAENPLRLQLALALDGTVTGKVNEQALATEKPLTLPAGEAASVLLQIRLPRDKAGMTIPTLTVTGKP